MIASDEDLLICDFAEYYGIYDIYSQPLNLVQRLAFGLRDDSRIKRKIAQDCGIPHATLDQMLLAEIADRLGIIICQNSGRTTPLPSLYEELISGPKPKNTVSGFDTPEEFEQARLRIINKEK